MEKNKIDTIKVCYFTHESNLTGASQSLLDILDGIKDSNINPVVLIRKKGPLEDELKKREVEYKIIYYAQTIKPANKRSFFKSKIKQIVNTIQEKKIVEFLKREDIDIVHNNSLIAVNGMMAAYKTHIPYICHIREVLSGDHALRPLDVNVFKKCLNNASCIIAISKYVQQQYKTIIQDNTCIIAYDGINIKKYYNNHKKLFSEKRIKVLLAGRIERGKRQMDAVKAISLLNKKNKNYELYIVGDDAHNSDYPDKLRELIECERIDNVQVLPFQDLNELRKKSDICLLCSSNEALGRVIIEGMLSGCLVIGANACATPEIIKDGETGFLYEAGDIVSLMESIERANNNKNEARLIAENGQESAIEYDLKKYVKNIVDLYGTIIDNNIG